MSTALAVRRAFSVAKAQGTANEDDHRYSNPRGVYAVSDGASISYDSASWSRILVEWFKKKPSFHLEWLAEAIAEFNGLHDRNVLPWMKQAAFDRGSFASLVGMRLHRQEQEVRVLAIGDSLAVLCEGDEVIASYPYTSPEQFSQTPQLLSTNQAENAFLIDADISREFSVLWRLPELKGPSIHCMTDALGQWVLANREANPSPVWIFRQISSTAIFRKFVLKERAAGRLRRDDTTLLSLW